MQLPASHSALGMHSAPAVMDPAQQARMLPAVKTASPVHPAFVTFPPQRSSVRRHHCDLPADSVCAHNRTSCRCCCRQKCLWQPSSPASTSCTRATLVRLGEMMYENSHAWALSAVLHVMRLLWRHSSPGHLRCRSKPGMILDDSDSCLSCS